MSAKNLKKNNNITTLSSDLGHKHKIVFNSVNKLVLFCYKMCNQKFICYKYVIINRYLLHICHSISETLFNNIYNLKYYILIVCLVVILPFAKSHRELI